MPRLGFRVLGTSSLLASSLVLTCSLLITAGCAQAWQNRGVGSKAVCTPILFQQPLTNHTRTGRTQAAHHHGGACTRSLICPVRAQPPACPAPGCTWPYPSSSPTHPPHPPPRRMRRPCRACRRSCRRCQVSCAHVFCAVLVHACVHPAARSSTHEGPRRNARSSATMRERAGRRLPLASAPPFLSPQSRTTTS